MAISPLSKPGTGGNTFLCWSHEHAATTNCTKHKLVQSQLQYYKTHCVEVWGPIEEVLGAEFVGPKLFLPQANPPSIEKKIFMMCQLTVGWDRDGKR